MATLTIEQKHKICKYLVNKYAPVCEDGIVHRVWVACEHCPFGPTGCSDKLTNVKLSKELKAIIDVENIK